MNRNIIFILISTCFVSVDQAYSQKSKLELVATIPMPNVRGRIDHLAIDLKRGIIFVAALANNTIEVADLKNKKVIHTIKNLSEPQGIIFIPENKTIFVANGGTGECSIFNAETFQTIGSLKLSGDADNVRYDSRDKKIYVGYGHGGIAIVDAVSYELISEIKLSGHPESFQLDRSGKRIFVNVPDSKQIEVIDLKTNKVIATWKVDESKNYPMTLDEPNHRLFIGCRQSPKVLVIDTETGKTISSQNIDDDVDDIFYNSMSKEIYLSCGGGYVDVLKQESPDKYLPLGKVSSRPGARTCLFVSESNQVIVASPARDGREAALLIFKVD